jgi:hypothetical protein
MLSVEYNENWLVISLHGSLSLSLSLTRDDIPSALDTPSRSVFETAKVRERNTCGHPSARVSCSATASIGSFCPSVSRHRKRPGSRVLVAYSRAAHDCVCFSAPQLARLYSCRVVSAGAGTAAHMAAATDGSFPAQSAVHIPMPRTPCAIDRQTDRRHTHILASTQCMIP